MFAAQKIRVCSRSGPHGSQPAFRCPAFRLQDHEILDNMMTTGRKDRLLDETTRLKLTGLIMQQMGDQATLDDDALKRLVILTIAHEYAGSKLSFQERTAIASGLFN